MRTMIDIFKKGNQELFHSTVIAWLLDSKAEHLLGRQFIDGVADTLEEKGDAFFKNFIAGQEPVVLTESKGRKSRYDIEVRVGSEKVVFENKTKSLGGRVQYDKYLDAKVKVIPLGFSEYSFDKSISSECVTLEYVDIYSILNNLDYPENDYGVLVKHYSDFLARDLSLFDLIKEVYAEGDIDRHQEINEIINSVNGYSDNDIRFLNLYFFELFKDISLSGDNYSGTKWTSNKSMQSGVWLANLGQKSEGFQFSKEIQSLVGKYDAKFWLHIDLWEGVSANDLEDTVGMIQLRASCKNDNKSLVNNIKKLNLLSSGQHYPLRVTKKAKTFYCIGEKLQKKDLQFSVLKNRISKFMDHFSA